MTKKKIYMVRGPRGETPTTLLATFRVRVGTRTLTLHITRHALMRSDGVTLTESRTRYSFPGLVADGRTRRPRAWLVARGRQMIAAVIRVHGAAHILAVIDAALAQLAPTNRKATP